MSEVVVDVLTRDLPDMVPKVAPLLVETLVIERRTCDIVNTLKAEPMRSGVEIVALHAGNPESRSIDSRGYVAEDIVATTAEEAQRPIDIERSSDVVDVESSEGFRGDIERDRGGLSGGIEGEIEGEMQGIREREIRPVIHDSIVGDHLGEVGDGFVEEERYILAWFAKQRRVFLFNGVIDDVVRDCGRDTVDGTVVEVRVVAERDDVQRDRDGRAIGLDVSQLVPAVVEEGLHLAAGDEDGIDGDTLG